MSVIDIRIHVRIAGTNSNKVATSFWVQNSIIRTDCSDSGQSETVCNFLNSERENQQKLILCWLL